MELTPWKPWQPLKQKDSFHREMDHFWDRFFGHALPARMGTAEGLPRLDVSETDDFLIVEAELPGLEKKDIDVNLSGDILTIKGEKQEERKENGKHYHCMECQSGSFQRSFKLPVSVQGGKVDANFDKGLLKIMLPKTEESKEKSLKINIH